MKLRHLLMTFCLFPMYMFACITGTYNVTGHDANLNEDYTGTAVITKLNDVYTIVWTYPNFSTVTGTGVIRDDFLSVVFNDGTSDYWGTQLYEIHGKTLKGPWVLFEQTPVSCEKLKKVSNVTVQ